MACCIVLSAWLCFAGLACLIAAAIMSYDEPYVEPAEAAAPKAWTMMDDAAPSLAAEHAPAGSSIDTEAKLSTVSREAAEGSQDGSEATAHIHGIVEQLNLDEVEPFMDAPDPDGAVARALARIEDAYPADSINRVRGGVARDAAKREVLESIGSDHPAIYGEVPARTVAAMLHKVGARPGQRFYDLGSGIGKPAAMAWLLGLDAVGVELVSLRWKVSCETLSRFQKKILDHPSSDSSVPSHALTFVHASFLKLDFSDADIVFANSVSFTKELTQGLAHGARRMKPGSLVILAKNAYSKLLTPGFRMIKKFVGPTSWANDSVWTVHVVEDNASAATNFTGEEEALKTLNAVSKDEKCSIQR